MMAVALNVGIWIGQFYLGIQEENSKSCPEVVKMFFLRFEVSKAYYSS